MEIIKIKAEKLTKEKFAPYGDLIGFQDSTPLISNDILKFWPCQSLTDTESGVCQFAWLEIECQKINICEKLDRHLSSNEANIPIKGQSIIVVALAEDINNTKSQINLNSIKTFILNAKQAINIKRGIWHSAPFAISSKASFVVVFDKEVHIKDMVTIDLKKELNISFNLTI